MTDLQYDFTANDIVISGGDFAMINMCSLQNATLIFNKSAASITAPQYGAGFEEVFANLPRREFGAIQSIGEKLIRSDGAKIAKIAIAEKNNKTQVSIQAKYVE